MDFDLFIRWLHIIGACVLFGTGSGIAFFMVMSHKTRNPVLIAHTAGTVVLADLLFTATAVVVQPITGVTLAHRIGWPLTELWVSASLGLYVFAGLFWLPVVWIQMEMRKLAALAASTQDVLPPRYFKLYRIWFACGFPAFAAVLGIIWLMISKPTF
ncbi:DUF2269 domain-containing protein [Rhizobium sp. BK176]|uniref:DUF2269 family protein n=1 Tax=Rhizobium sp. BK176 TaxID=2587071 RepID=UPI00216870BF|nr:DUF2269 domain-containing protein [Rhizobium sp. BK176]MCS4089359.1 putative membrane protein [Rhizobium sp. BK176]